MVKYFVLRSKLTNEILFKKKLFNKKCKNPNCDQKTVYVHPWCPDCLVKEKKLVISESRIKNAGNGLFCWDGTNVISTIFREDDIVAEYMGELITEEENERRFLHPPHGSISPYGYELEDGTNLDGSCFRGSAVYANHSIKPNVEFFEVDRKLYLVALKNIKNMEEILVDYGDEYFESNHDIKFKIEDL